MTRRRCETRASRAGRRPAQERAELYQRGRILCFARITDTASMKIRRHNIARILTVITEKKKEAERLNG